MSDLILVNFVRMVPLAIILIFVWLLIRHFNKNKKFEPLTQTEIDKRRKDEGLQSQESLRFETPDTSYYYIENGLKVGPVQKDDLQKLHKQGEVSDTTLVWNEAFGSKWRELHTTELLLDPSSPPPIPLNAIPLGWLILLILVPILMIPVELFTLEQRPDLVSGFFILYWIVNATIATRDQRLISNAGRVENAKGLIFWALFLVPVYIFMRGRRTGLGLWPFAGWIVSFVVGTTAVNYLPNYVYFGAGIPSCDSTISQAMIREIYPTIPFVMGGLVAQINGIREVSSQDTSTRQCSATVVDARGASRAITYSIIEAGDEYYWNVELAWR
ncbi:MULTISPECIES: DUF4339 domain-containing protein [unclassified Yoonia]|uniref:DUF4339 domain-containing protein n=1 Tax=unclassified Yoonia TaxID=2629118 RepID=UPI002AFED7E8|nr:MULTISPECIES: DUF4339 domain-containing protein [unclassified Yoonia]